MFCELFPPLIYGGGEVLFWNLAKSLVTRGHEVYVITRKVAGARGSEVTLGVNIRRVGLSENYGGALTTNSLNSLAYLVAAFFTGIRIGLRRHIDIIHSNTYVPALAGQLCATILRRKHLMTIHDVYLTSLPWFWKNWSQQPTVGRVARVMGPLLERFFFVMPVTAIQTVSETSKRDLLQAGARSRIVVVPNGISLGEHKRHDAVPTNSHQAIFIGRLVFYKNLEVVFHALARVIRVVPDARLAVVGDGPMRGAWQKIVSDLGLERHVHFCGVTPQQEKLRLLDQSAFLVLPSMVEGFGIVILEAFSSKKAVLASTIGALRELVSDEVDGYLVDPASETDWANRMIMLFEDPERARHMGMMGCNKVVANFTTDRVAARMEGLYYSLLGRGYSKSNHA